MCHERWITHSDTAVERSWLRSLARREREEPPIATPTRLPETEQRDETQLEVVGER